MSLGTELTEAEFTKLRALIYKIAGISIPDTKSLMMSNRLRRRLRATGIKTFAEYLAFLTSPSATAEMPMFLDEVTTNETYFYRDGHHFEWLSETYFPGILKAGTVGSRPKRLRIWSAASSTGEELYSIALKFQPFKSRFVGWTVDFLGTDLSKAALDCASAGVYEDRAMRNVPAAERSRYFDHDPTTKKWRLKDEVRGGIRWKSHNLMNPFPGDSFDCVFIKNVLIYFDAASKQAATTNLIRALAVGGSLVVGPTEGIFTMLGSLEKRSAWLYEKPASFEFGTRKV